jgi:hypothetical protein
MCLVTMCAVNSHQMLVYALLPRLEQPAWGTVGLLTCEIEQRL